MHARNIPSSSAAHAALVLVLVLVSALGGCASGPVTPPAANAAPASALAATAAPAGEVKGAAWQHTPATLEAAVQTGRLALPASATGGAVYVGPLRDAPRQLRARVPVVVFLHGSSGLGLAAIGDWQRWLADMGIASLAPDSFTLPDRITYKSPVAREVYERVHALRQSEAVAAVAAVRASAWADPARVVLAGTSEGATSVARYSGEGVIGRVMYAWSCEANYFV